LIDGRFKQKALSLWDIKINRRRKVMQERKKLAKELEKEREERERLSKEYEILLAEMARLKQNEQDNKKSS
jgi:hypothetical protein